MSANESLRRQLGNDSIDAATFAQILEMDDDDDDREFSKSIVFGFFEQAESTFEKMEAKIEEEDLEELSALGHFLKGSSATLGLTNMKNGCEKIQHWGKGMDETGTNKEDKEKCIEGIAKELKAIQRDYESVERSLKVFYADT